MLVIEKGKTLKSVVIELPDDKVIKSLQGGESYNYIGILEADRFLGEEMKQKVSKEYFRMLKIVLKSKLKFSSRSQYLGPLKIVVESVICRL